MRLFEFVLTLKWIWPRHLPDIIASRPEGTWKICWHFGKKAKTMRKFGSRTSSIIVEVARGMNATNNPIGTSLADLRSLIRLLNILRRAGVIDHHNTIFINKPNTDSEHEDDEVVQNFNHVQNAQFRDISFYRQLNASLKEIRLVELLPASFEEPLRCTLTSNVSLSSLHMNYSTLSYVVGDVSQCGSIRLNNSQFRVTKNLEGALRYIRERDRPVRLWVDQICINQMRHSERAEQVMLMCEIYSKADQTLVWLGDLPEQSRAFDFVEDILEAYESVLENKSPVVVKDGSSLQRLLDMLEEPLPDHHDLSARHAYQTRAIELLSASEIFNVPIQHTTESLADLIKTADGMRKFRAFVSLKDCPYWQRSWVWQEITVSMEPVLVCGSKRISLIDYILAFRICHACFNSQDFPRLKAEEGTPLPDEVRISQSQRYADMKPMELYMIRQVWWNSSLTLRQVLAFSRQLESTDPRDKIYGILSTVSEAYRITPDYRASMTPNRLFLLATIRSILVDDNLDILSDGQETNRFYRSQRALPSWVPDFSVFNRRKPSIPAISPEQEKLSLFRATLDTKPCASFIKSDKLGPSTVLRLTGIPLGNSFHAKDLGAVSGRGAVQKWIDFLIQRCPDASEVCLPTSPDESVMQSFFRSVMFGMELYELTPLIGQDNTVDTKFVRQSFVVDTIGKNMAQLEELEEWRFFFIEADDIMGMVPAKTAPNDRMVFFLGSKVPFVVRQSATGYELVGPCYVHGYMHGRILDEQKVVREEFDIY